MSLVLIHANIDDNHMIHLQVLDKDIVVEKDSGHVDLYVQLSPAKKRLIHYKAKIEASPAGFGLVKQFVNVAPFVLANTNLSGAQV